MVEKIDPLIEDMLKKYDLDPDEALWPMDRKDRRTGRTTRTWIMYHSAIELVAGRAGISFSPPQVLECDLVKKAVCIIVSGTMGKGDDVITEWATGESAPYNTKIGYPAAMAEKRSKDRVVLKLLGIHGLVYSEEEADDFKQKDVVDGDGNDTGFKAVGSRSAYAMKKDNPNAWSEAVQDIRDAQSMGELQAVERSLMERFKVQGWPAHWGPELRRELDTAYKDMTDFEVARGMNNNQGEENV
jgi:hypothetical protein